MSNSTLQRSAPAPSAPRASSAIVSNSANYGLLFVFLLIMLVFGLLWPSSFFSATNLNAIFVSQSVTAILALAAMAPGNETIRSFDWLSPRHGAGADRRPASHPGLGVAVGRRADLACVLGGWLGQRPPGDVFPHRFLHRHHGHRNPSLRRDQLVLERRTNRRDEFTGQFYRPHSNRPRHSPPGRLCRDHCCGVVDRD